MYKHQHTLANALDRYRQRMGLKLSDVAHLLGHADTSALAAFERGSRLPSLRNALRLSIILRVPVEFLFPALYDDLRQRIRSEEARSMPEKTGGKGAP